MKKLVLNFFIVGMILGICLMSFYNFNISREIDIKAAEIINSYDRNEINLAGEKLVVTDTQLNNICNILKNDKYKNYINNLTDDYLRNNFGKVRRNIKELSGYNAGTPDEEIENTEYDIVMTYLYYRVNAIKLLEELVDGKLVTTEYEELKNDDYIRKNASELLGYARDVKEKIEILGLIYRVSKICNYGDENDTTKVSYDEFAERAKLEMEYVCSEDKNWLSTSFLGTAELAYSIGLGYDWFQEYLPMETKEIIEKAIIKNALIPFCLDAQDDTFTNITEVSYSGIGVAALSILDTEYNINLEQSNQYYKVTSEEFIINDTENIIKNVNTIVDSEIINILNTEILENNTNSITSQELSTAILKKVLTKMPIVLQNVYDEGGIYREGPMYWGYGTSYISYFLTSVNNTLGSDFVKNILGQVKGLEKMLLYPIYVSNNIYTGDYNVFNYSDSQAKFTCAGYDDMGLANLYAEVTGNMQYTQALYYFKNRLSGNAYGYYNMIWYNPKYDKEVNLEKIVNDTILQNASYKSGIAMLRTNYIDNKYIFTGLRGGNNYENHAQLDKGSFIFEALGTRWIEEPEYSPYSSKNYFGGYPYGYQYYLKRAESHNTIVINPQNDNEVEVNGYAEPEQYIYAETEFIKIESQDNASISILDLSSAYNKEKNGIESASENSNTVLRGIKLFDSKKYMVLQDEVSLENEGEIYSFLNINNSEISNIEISNNGREVILTDNGNQQLKLKLICDNEIARFEKMDKKALNDYLNKENDNFTYTSNLQYQYKDDDGNAKYYQKLAIHLENVKETRITVVFIPIYSVNEELEYTEENVVDLAEWYIPTTPEIIAKTEYDESINNNETVYGSVKLDLKSSQGKEEEIILYSLDNGETWKKYTENITFDIAGEYSILTKAVDKTKSESNISRLSFEIQRKVVEKIEVTKLPNKLNYLPKDEKIDLTGGILTVTYNDGKTEEVELISNEVEVSGYNSEKLGGQTITVTYGSCATTFKVMVAKAIPEYMIPTDITATVGQQLSEIELPEGFEWMDENQIIDGSGNIIYKAKYIPEDTTNYEIVENVEISINVVSAKEVHVEYEYIEETNEVIAKIISTVKLKDTKPTWKLSEDRKVYTKLFTENIKYTTPVQDINGKITDLEININQIKITQLETNYIYDGEKNEVTVQIISNIELKDTKPTWKLSEDKKIYTKVFTENMKYTTPVQDKWGNMIDANIKVTEVKKLELRTEYEHDSETNQVVAKIMSNIVLKDTKPTWKLSEDKKIYTKIYDVNQTYNTIVESINGERVNVELNIDKVDDKGPEISLKYKYNSDNTVTIYMESNEKLRDTKPTWKLSADQMTYEKTYSTDEENYITQVQDIYGNITDVRIVLKKKYEVLALGNANVKIAYIYTADNNVIVQLISSKELENTKPTWVLSDDRKTYTKVFFYNQEYTTVILFIDGKKYDIKISINYF